MRQTVLAMVVALLLGMAFAPRAHAVDPLPFKDRAQELRFQHLAGQLRCLVCQDESLLASQATLAKQLRHKIFHLMQEGKTDAQIKQYLVDRYSDYVLYNPPLKPDTWLLWFGPGIFLVLGAIGVAVYVRRRSVGAPETPPPPPTGHDDW